MLEKIRNRFMTWQRFSYLMRNLSKLDRIDEVWKYCFIFAMVKANGLSRSAAYKLYDKLDIYKWNYVNDLLRSGLYLPGDNATEEFYRSAYGIAQYPDLNRMMYTHILFLYAKSQRFAVKKKHQKPSTDGHE